MRRVGGVRDGFSWTFRGALLAMAWTHAAQGTPAGPRILSFVPETRSVAAVRVSVRRARVRVETPACGLVYSDFRDRSGRALEANLAATGQSGAEHFSSLVFEIGDGSAPCARESVMAYTSSGSRTIHVCSRQFAALFFGDTERAVATLIHEQLHSLGLGENPPTSLEITERVLARCRP